MVDINEPIEVVVLFKKSSIIPYLFFWHRRKIKLTNINLVHTSIEGSKLFYHFSTSSGGNFYKLKFSVGDLKWELEEIEVNDCAG